MRRWLFFGGFDLLRNAPRSSMPFSSIWQWTKTCFEILDMILWLSWLSLSTAAQGTQEQLTEYDLQLDVKGMPKKKKRKNGSWTPSQRKNKCHKITNVLRTFLFAYAITLSNPWQHMQSDLDHVMEIKTRSVSWPTSDLTTHPGWQEITSKTKQADKASGTRCVAPLDQHWRHARKVIVPTTPTKSGRTVVHLEVVPCLDQIERRGNVTSIKYTVKLRSLHSAFTIRLHKCSVWKDESGILSR